MNRHAADSDDRRIAREQRERRREANRAGRLWLEHELAHRSMTRHDLWQRMLPYGDVGYSTVTAYVRGDIPTTEKAEMLASALNLDVSEIYGAASGRDPAGLSHNQRLRLKARL